MNHPTIESQPHSTPYDQPRYQDVHLQDHHQNQNLPTQSLKISTHGHNHNIDHLEHSTANHSLPTDHLQDASSIHSLPTIHVPEPSPHSPIPNRPSTLPDGDSASSLAAPSLPTASLSRQERQTRHRSAIEVRGANRLSGFFNNLIHRRDTQASPNARSPLREDNPRTTTPDLITESNSRPPTPPARPVTPPPALPAPTLQELGLSLSILTSDLSPSHFSTPPTSGAFLSPYYLLLCHAQGLDVLPLMSPPVLQPYALVRRVPFKSVVVMEQRGVLVAIAGRRDGVRVYALEEVKRAVEWRMDVEIKRERERMRREAGKKTTFSISDNSLERANRKSNLSNSPVNVHKSNPPNSLPQIPPVPPAPLIPRRPTTRKVITAQPQLLQVPTDQPPSYSTSMEVSSPIDQQELPPTISVTTSRPRGSSISNVLAAAPHVRLRGHSRSREGGKADWVESSDEEAIDIVAAGSSGSQALDERTSSQLSSANPAVSLTSSSSSQVQPLPTAQRLTRTTSRRSRPANLDLSLVNSAIPPEEPSPAPTLLTLRQALASQLPGPEPPTLPNTPSATTEIEGDDDAGHISLAQALMESRIPELPPLGSRRSQQPILITASHPIVTGEEEPMSPRTSESHTSAPRASGSERPPQRRRRWSVMLGQNSNNLASVSRDVPRMPTDEVISTQSRRSQSFQAVLPENLASTASSIPPSVTLVSSSGHPPATPPAPRSSRFIPRLFTNPFQSRRSDDHTIAAADKSDAESSKRLPLGPPSQLPPPKLEYVKLPGTKNALLVKAVETKKKSFLAILCGENGEKVELFAGTYRTALGLSRTFILPDSPRSLELQLQGDDLVEVFLVFSQNVFGLEPATVRVREVRIGRAERRAARRRARELRQGEAAETDTAVAAEEDANINLSVGVSVSIDSGPAADGEREALPRPSTTEPFVDNPEQITSLTETAVAAHAEELVTLATTQVGPYTTFQQLGFAPKFPLATIADDYIIPPTYPDFLGYRTEHEPDSAADSTDLAQVQFSPPGLPVPQPTPPSRWYYRDPKGVIHGPWKASLMQAWYKDGLLPPDLPVRKEEDNEYILLKDLRLQSVDPMYPFRSLPPSLPPINSFKPLLPPVSLLAQPRHFGPPPLFFSSKGGHSTTIVDARGRSVLKGRFVWSNDDVDPVRMGDIKRLEAFDVNDRSVLIAMRQGGLEAVDVGDALLKPADESRTILPQFTPTASMISRRNPFVWRIGTPIELNGTSSLITSPCQSTTSLPLPNKLGKFTAASGNNGSSIMTPVTNKKHNLGSARSPAGRAEFLSADLDTGPRDEVLFLGRKEDEVYFCERNAGSFRILRLCPNGVATSSR